MIRAEEMGLGEVAHWFFGAAERWPQTFEARDLGQLWTWAHEHVYEQGQETESERRRLLVQALRAGLLKRARTACNRCTGCDLHQNRLPSRPVYDDGDLDNDLFARWENNRAPIGTTSAEILVLGEGPGSFEQRTGFPFVSYQGLAGASVCAYACANYDGCFNSQSKFPQGECTPVMLRKTLKEQGTHPDELEGTLIQIRTDRASAPVFSIQTAGNCLDKVIFKAGLWREVWNSRARLQGQEPRIGTVYVTNVVKCLEGHTRVLLEDGTWERVARLVTQQYKGKVMSVTDDGRLAARSVTGWYRTPRAGRKLYRVTFADARRSHRGPPGFVATGDHPVLARQGWVNVEDLAPGDEICTGKLAPSDRQKQLILASLLGDAYRSTRSTSLHFGHSAKQAAYIEYKRDLLSTLGVSEIKESVTREGHHVRRFRLNASRSLAPLFRQSAVEWVRQLDDFGLACWFMDDGHMKLGQGGRRPNADLPVIRFAAYAQEIAQALQDKGLNCSVHQSSAGPRLFFGVEAAAELSQRIAPYMPPSMRYKLCPQHQEISAEAGTWPSPTPDLFYSPVVAEEVNATGIETVYCIDVEETHNFVTPGGVVHNCRSMDSQGKDKTPTLKQMDACQEWLEQQIYIIQPKVIVALGNAAIRTAAGLEEPKVLSRRGEVYPCPWMGVPVVVDVHPSYIIRQEDKAKQEEFTGYLVESFELAKRIAAGEAGLFEEKGLVAQSNCQECGDAYREHTPVIVEAEGGEEVSVLQCPPTATIMAASTKPEVTRVTTGEESFLDGEQDEAPPAVAQAPEEEPHEGDHGTILPSQAKFVPTEPEEDE